VHIMGRLGKGGYMGEQTITNGGTGFSILEMIPHVPQGASQTGKQFRGKGRALLSRTKKARQKIKGAVMGLASKGGSQRTWQEGSCRQKRDRVNGSRNMGGIRKKKPQVTTRAR